MVKSREKKNERVEKSGRGKERSQVDVRRKTWRKHRTTHIMVRAFGQF